MNEHDIQYSHKKLFFISPYNDCDLHCFTGYHYHIQIAFGNPKGAKHWRGQLYSTLHGTKGQISDSLLTDE